MWQAMLSRRRFAQHQMWVEDISAIQAKLPVDCVAPRLLPELHRDFATRPNPWARDGVPERQVYVQGCRSFKKRNSLS